MQDAHLLITIHDATPAYEHETRIILRDLAPLVGRRLSFAVVPDWRGAWPLASHPRYCRLIDEGAEELLLHGYYHHRERGFGPVSLLAERSDEMNGLDAAKTRALIERGQHDLKANFGRGARGFLPPAWQAGHVREVALGTPSTIEIADSAKDLRLDYVLGFTALDTRTGHHVPLTTWTWDCGRWDWLGNIGHGVGRTLHALGRGTPTLAIHPRDVSRGFWPRILRLTRELLSAGYAPTTPLSLLDDRDAQSKPERAA